MREIYNKNMQYSKVDPKKVDQLKKEIHGLKLKNEKLKIQAIEREKMIKILTTPSNNGG